MQDGINKAIIGTLNTAADVVDFSLRKPLRMVAPTGVGAIGGWLSGVGWRMGAFQGAVAGGLYSFCLIPAGNYIHRHAGNGDGELHQNTQNMLYTIGTVSEIAIPILTTMYLGQAALEAAGECSPASLSWLFLPAVASVPYSVWRGVLVNIAPALTQVCIEGARAANAKSKEA